MWENLEEVSLIQARVVSELVNYVKSIKTQVDQGVMAADLAAQHVGLYGNGLAKALFVAEDVLQGRNSELKLLVNRITHDVRNMCN